MFEDFFTFRYISTSVFIDIFIFLIVFVISNYGINKILGEKKMSIIIAAIIALLATTYTTQGQFYFHWLATGYVGLIVLVALPFSIVFFFIYGSNIDSLARKAIWIFYGIMTWAIWNKTSTLSSDATTLFLVIFSLAILLMLFFDKSIKTKFNERKALKKY